MLRYIVSAFSCSLPSLISQYCHPCVIANRCAAQIDVSADYEQLIAAMIGLCRKYGLADLERRISEIMVSPGSQLTVPVLADQSAINGAMT